VDNERFQHPTMIIKVLLALYIAINVSRAKKIETNNL